MAFFIDKMVLEPFDIHEPIEINPDCQFKTWREKTEYELYIKSFNLERPLNPKEILGAGPHTRGFVLYRRLYDASKPRSRKNYR